MERRKEETLSNVLLRFLRMQGLETPLAEHRLLQSWETVVGRMVAAKSRDLFVKGQCLHVTLSLSRASQRTDHAQDGTGASAERKSRSERHQRHRVSLRNPRGEGVEASLHECSFCVEHESRGMSECSYNK